jgi:hypothetical protein
MSLQTPWYDASETSICKNHTYSGLSEGLWLTENSPRHRACSSQPGCNHRDTGLPGDLLERKLLPVLQGLRFPIRDWQKFGPCNLSSSGTLFMDMLQQIAKRHYGVENLDCKSLVIFTRERRTILYLIFAHGYFN